MKTINLIGGFFLFIRRIEGDVLQVQAQQPRPIGVQPARALRPLIEGNISIFITREGGDIGLLITLVPNFYKDVFYIRWLNNFGNFY